jgi:hypothetical protein
MGLTNRKLCDLFLWFALNVDATTKTNTLSDFGDIFDIDLFVSI